MVFKFSTSQFEIYERIEVFYPFHIFQAGLFNWSSPFSVPRRKNLQLLLEVAIASRTVSDRYKLKNDMEKSVAYRQDVRECPGQRGNAARSDSRVRRGCVLGTVPYTSRPGV